RRRGGAMDLHGGTVGVGILRYERAGSGQQKDGAVKCGFSHGWFLVEHQTAAVGMWNIRARMATLFFSGLTAQTISLRPHPLQRQCTLRRQKKDAIRRAA